MTCSPGTRNNVTRFGDCGRHMLRYCVLRFACLNWQFMVVLFGPVLLLVWWLPHIPINLSIQIAGS